MDRAAIQTKLETALERVATELAEGDIKPNYSINGQSVSWADYRTSLMEQLSRLQELIDEVGDDDGGIVMEETQQYT